MRRSEQEAEPFQGHMRHKLVVSLSMLFKVHGGMPRFNQMLCLALDDLAPSLGLDVKVVSQEDETEDYRSHGAPWRHIVFVDSDSRRDGLFAKTGSLVRVVRRLRPTTGGSPGGAEPGGTHEQLIQRWQSSRGEGTGPEKLASVSWRTWSLCRRERPDLLLLGLLGMTPLGVVCQPWLGRGFGFVAHGTECWLEPRRSRRWAARRASFAFAVSGNTADSLSDVTGMARERIHLLPNTLAPALELPPLDEGMPRTEGGRGGPRLLSVARLWAEERMKGIDHTLEAFAGLLEHHPEAYYRVIGKGSDKPRLQRLAETLGISHQVGFEEDLTDDELSKAFRDCDIFVLPSGQEGFGIVFLEAMRFGKPCIGGAAGGTPEVIEDGISGLLVPFGDEAALKQALARLMGDADLRVRIGRAGRRRLEERFVFPRFRERLEAHLRRLLDSASRAN
jgi:phosphatidylinositol alpha-1,6-mannosyltransferase